MGTPTLAQGAANPQSLRIDSAAGGGGGINSLLFGLAASWAAAGGFGLVGHTLRHGVTLTLLGACLAQALPLFRQSISWRRGILLGLTVVLASILSTSSQASVAVMSGALMLAGIAWLRPLSGQGRFLIAATSVLVLGLYRFALMAFPEFWLLIDSVAKILTGAAGFVSRQPLHTGTTYAALDCLVLMLTLGGLLVAGTPGARRKQLGRVLAVIAAAQFLYLLTLSFGPKLLAALPTAPSAEATFGQKMPWHWAPAVRSLIPWNLPLVAVALHLAVAAWLFKRFPVSFESLDGRKGPKGPPGLGRLRLAAPALVVALALTVPALTMLSPQPLSLAGKKVVVYEKGFLNWLKPKHGEYGRLSVGMYGMLPEFLQSYGAQCVVSPELSAADLQGAHLLVLIFPNKPWTDGQMDRIWHFVREGGSLLVLGEHTVREKEGGNRFNDVLQPTAMRVAFDSSMFEIGGWLESYDALSHVATAGLTDYRNDFGVVIGASVEARWPARPVLIGRYGFSDPGDASNDESKGGSMMGNHKYDAGEKLGDQLLAAEQRFGRGRVMVFGDTSGFSNSILFGSHDFTARLYAYLCNEGGVTPGRKLAGGLCLALLLALVWVAGTPRPALLAFTAVAFAAALTWTTHKNHQAAAVLPDGRATSPNRLTYLDTSHLERSSLESWRETGLGGLELTLMRNGYLVLSLQEFDSARLDRAGLFISVAPSRPFATEEISAVRRFVENGGIFICTVGWPESGASRRLLADLGFFVGGIGAATSGQPEPKSFGHFKAPYFNGGDYMAYVRFHAAWPVESPDPQARPIAYGPRDPKGPADQPDPAVILMRRIGHGKVVVVADSEFAANKNLEREGGQPFEGMRENADFWRWLLDYLNDRQPWTPPKPLPTPPAQPADKSDSP